MALGEVGLFLSSWSAYKLGVDLRDLDSDLGSSSRHPDGARTVWKKLWSLPVPHLEHSPVCDICGMEEETEFHALVRCTHAATLRENMRASWPIPDERLLLSPGPEWLLHVIGASTKEEAGRLVLILWRVWFARTEWIHSGRWVGVEASIRFLMKYWEDLNGSTPQEGDDNKGKKAAEPLIVGVASTAQAKERWKPPDDGWLKENIDAAFSEHSGRQALGWL